MLMTKLRAILDYRMTVAELIGTLVMLALPYLAIGTVWSVTHSDHLQQMNRVDAVVSFLGSIASWPILWFSDVCMP